MADPQEIEEIELELMIDAIHRRYGHDFRNYARSSLKRRFVMLASESGAENVGQLIPQILRDESLWEHVFLRIAVTVSEFFRDPAFFRTLKEKVFPQLATYPAIRIWHAGCANGEEVYSLAILLEEAGLLDRCTIFATDFNDRALHAAEAGIYDSSKVEDACLRYDNAGGANAFRDYFTFSASHAKIKRHLTEAVTFANHNLATDQSFGDMHLILCRNTFIYFNGKLQSRAVQLFSESLVSRGWLALGSQETLRFCESANAFELFDSNYPIYQERRINVHRH